MQTYNVYLHGVKVDSVQYPKGTTNEEVQKLLINRDNYDPRIMVTTAREKKK